MALILACSTLEGEGGKINVQEIITRVQRVFGDEASVQITQDDIIRWINDAQEEIIVNNDGLMETIATASTVQGQDTYDFPSDLAVMRSLQYKGFRVKYFSLNEFNEYLDGWNTNVNNSIYGQGTPLVFMTFENKITVFPPPDQSLADALTIFYTRHPIQVSLVTDTPELPVQYHKAIVDYCLQQAYELDEDTQKQLVKDQSFTKRVMQLNDRNKRVSEYYPSITTLPEDDTFGSDYYLGWGYY